MGNFRKFFGLIFVMFACLSASGQIAPIANGESGLSVRGKLNTLIDNDNDFNALLDFSAATFVPVSDAFLDIGSFSNKFQSFYLSRSIWFLETTTAFSSVAGFGQLWVSDNSPNQLIFTDDVGTDFTLGLGLGAGKGMTSFGGLMDLGGILNSDAVFTGAFDLDFSNTAGIVNLVEPTAAQDAATMNYVDTEISAIAIFNISDDTNNDLIVGDAAQAGDVTMTVTSTDTDANLILVPKGVAGEFQVNPDTDLTTILGRARIDSRTTDVATFSHFDQTGVSAYGLNLFSNGNTSINGVGFLTLDIAGATEWTVSPTSLVGASGNNLTVDGDINLNNTATNQILLPTNNDLANPTIAFGTNTGIQETSDDQLSLIAGGVEGIRITEAASTATVNISGAYDLVPTDGAAGTVLTTNGIGVTSWSPVTGSTQELRLTVRKASAGTINQGDWVRIVGFDIGSGFAEVELADATSEATMPAIGCAQEAITNIAEGDILVVGQSGNIDTSLFAEADALFISETPGVMTNVKPTGTAVIQAVGVVLRSHATLGEMEIVGANRVNDLPNLASTKVWLGDVSGVPVQSVNFSYEEDVRLIAKGAGSNSIAIGSGANSTSPNAIVLGQDAEGSGSDAIAIGTNAADNGGGTDGDASISIGGGANQGQNIGESSIALGVATSARQTESIAFGLLSVSDGIGAIAMGSNSNVTSQGAILMGYHTSAQTNSLSDSYKVMFDGTTAFHVGNTLGTVITANVDPDANLGDAVDGAIAYNTTSGNLELRDGGAFAAVGGGGIGGSITDNQLAVGATAANDIEGTAGLTWESGNGQLVAGFSGESMLILEDLSQGVDLKGMRIEVDAGVMFFGTSNDARAGFSNHATLNRSTGDWDYISNNLTTTGTITSGATLAATDFNWSSATGGDLLLQNSTTGRIDIDFNSGTDTGAEPVAVINSTVGGGAVVTRPRLGFYNNGTAYTFVNGSQNWDFQGNDLIDVGGLFATADVTNDIGTSTVSFNNIYGESLFISEKADGDGDVATLGQIWVDNTTNQSLMFTDEAGTDFLVAGDDLSGLFTSTITDGTNVASTVFQGFIFSRVGDVVTFAISLNIDPTSTGLTDLRMTIPIPSNFTTGFHLSGTATDSTIGQSGIVAADTTNDELELTFTATSAATINWRITGSYIIL